MIKAEQLSIRYLDADDQLVTALSDISFHIAPGETVLLSGASGCGKTTLLRCLNALVPNFFPAEISGSLTLNGKPVMEHPTRELAARVGMVFQDPRSEFFTFDVASELAFCCENFAMPPEVIAEKVNAVAKRIGIQHLLERRIGGLSSGEKQKVAIGAALILEPQVLLFDEPSANLDLEGLEMLRSVLTNLKTQGVTVVLADHRLSYLNGILDRCLVLSKGRIVSEMTSEELAAAPAEWFAQVGLRRPQPLSCHFGEPGSVIASADGQSVTPVRCTSGTGRSSGAIGADGGSVADLDRQQSNQDASGDLVSSAGPQLARLVFNYPNRPKLWGIDELRLPSAGIIGITGANGSGKTTLMKVLLGLVRSRGDLRLAGRVWTRRQRARDCALVMQDVEYQLIGESVWDEVLIGSPPGAVTEARAAELLERVGLTEFRDRHPLTLSGGQKQRLGVALACMKQAKVICLDEPTSGLDAHNMRLLSELLKELADQGCLVLVITHDLEFTQLTFDQAIHIEDRQIRLRKLAVVPVAEPVARIAESAVATRLNGEPERERVIFNPATAE